MTKGEVIFLFDEDRISGQPLTKWPPRSDDFKISSEDIRLASMVVYTDPRFVSHVLKNRMGSEGPILSTEGYSSPSQ